MSIDILLNNIPLLEIATTLYRLYEKKKEREFFNNLTTLCAQEHKNGEAIFDILMRAFTEKYKKEILGKTLRQKLSELSELFFMGDPVLAPRHRTTSKTALKIGSIETIETSEGKIKRYFTVNPKIRKHFCDSMNKYFRYILSDKIIEKIMNADEFTNRFLLIHNQVGDSTDENFIKLLYFEEPKVLKELGIKKPSKKGQLRKHSKSD